MCRSAPLVLAHSNSQHAAWPIVAASYKGGGSCAKTSMPRWRIHTSASCRWPCTCECRQGLGCEACRTKYGRQSTAALPSWAQQCWAPSRARRCSVGALQCHQKLQTRCGASAKQRKQNGAAGTVGRQIFSLPAALRSDAVLYEPMLRVAAVCRAK